MQIQCGGRVFRLRWFSQLRGHWELKAMTAVTVGKSERPAGSLVAGEVFTGGGTADALVRGREIIIAFADPAPRPSVIREYRLCAHSFA